MFMIFPDMHINLRLGHNANPKLMCLRYEFGPQVSKPGGFSSGPGMVPIGSYGESERGSLRPTTTITGWWFLATPLKKYEYVNWDD